MKYIIEEIEKIKDKLSKIKKSTNYKKRIE